MQKRDLFRAERIPDETGGQTALLAVRGDGAEEIGVVAAFGQIRRGGRRRDGNLFRIRINGQGGLGGSGADRTHDHVHTLGQQLGGGVGAKLRLALVILGDDLHLPAEDAALGVDFLDNNAGRVETWLPVGHEIARMRAGDTEFDGVGGMSRRRQPRQGQSSDCGFQPCACHKASPRIWVIAVNAGSGAFPGTVREQGCGTPHENVSVP